jgi:hypothetical protein
MGVFKSAASPNSTRFHSVPDLVPLRADRALRKLLSMTEGQRRDALLQIVDFGALTELQSAIAIKGNAENLDLRDLHQDVSLCRSAVAARRSFAMGSGRAERRQAEALDRKVEKVTDDLYPPSQQEFSRRFEADRLWEQSGVTIGIETYPDGGDENLETEEKQLKDMVKTRHHAGLCDIPIAISHFSFIALQIRVSAIVTWKDAPVYRDPFGLYNEAVCFVRELRFSAHALPGSDTEQAGYVFSGEFVDEDQLRSPDAIAAFRDTPKYLAPGASVLLDGCKVGRGPAGKSFMGAFADLLFGSHKWGFIKGNQISTERGPIPTHPLPPKEPVTYRWPDDFR